MNSSLPRWECGNREVAQFNPTNSMVTLMTKFMEGLAFSGRSTPFRDHLEAVIVLGRHALTNTAPGSSFSSTTFTILADALLNRYWLDGERRHMDEAILVNWQAVQFLDPLSSAKDHDSLLNLSFALYKLSWMYGYRFTRTRDSRDINNAIVIAEQALMHMPKEHTEWSNSKDRLGQLYLVRYRYLNDITDLSSANSHLQESVDSVGLGRLRRPTSMSLLAEGLALKLKIEYSDQEWETALSLTQDTWESYYSRPEAFNNLHPFPWFGSFSQPWQSQDRLILAPIYHTFSILWSLKFQASMNPIDYRRAEEYARQCLDTTTPEHPDKARYFTNLAAIYGSRCTLNPDPFNDVDQQYFAFTNALQLLENAITDETIHPATRIDFVQEALRSGWLQHHWSSNRNAQVMRASLMKKAVDLVPSALARHATRKEQHKQLRGLSDIVAFTADCMMRVESTHSNTVEALLLLARHRGVFLNHELDIRMDVSKPMTIDSSSSTAFEDLYCSLGTRSGTLDSPTSPQSGLSSEMDTIVRSIEALEGFESFPVAPNLDDLCNAVGENSTIVLFNIPKYASLGGHAFCITKDGISAIQLANGWHFLEIEATSLFAPGRKDITETLGVLWEVFTEPVLRHLNITKPCGDEEEWPTVCWIPSGPLNMLPLHAAGWHDGTGQSVIDRVISSYSPSLRALLYTKHNAREGNRQSRTKRVNIASMRTSMGFSSLQHAEDEARIIQGLLSNDESISCKNMRNPDKQSVLEAIAQDCWSFHFAGHGVTDGSDPLQSRLILGQGTSLKVSDLMELKLHKDPPFMAYLSACSTGKQEFGDLLDESIHLTGACQLAGFQHVIGSLWSVSDWSSSQVAEDVYKRLTCQPTNDACVVKALHFAVRKFRACPALYNRGAVGDAFRNGDITEIPTSYDAVTFKGTDPALWAPYIHVGLF
ncbi:30S ribosomal S17P protein [Fusarium pseudocircinatum]|uniref:30S ribosomal S17P protein n=1 Tax=Fusarium pseudocircinatum TaxID=56676 RepID=A0A8H5KYG1_9HYPO|nr:30S ribosomal S17P protein [Fusarium pseudocircinatum]